MKSILVVEDELSIRSFICLNLRKKNYAILEAKTGEEAISLFQNNYIDIVLLDIMLPGMDGFEVCNEIRKRNPVVGIIMLTARALEEDKVKGLIKGADDYLAKPFSMVELEARIQSLLRRLEAVASTSIRPSSVDTSLSAEPFFLDLNQKKIFCLDKEIKVTPTEFLILHFLINNRGKVFSRDDLLNEIWGVDFVGDVKVVDVNIRRIRSKIELDASNPVYLLTVWGHGYMWKG